MNRRDKLDLWYRLGPKQWIRNKVFEARRWIADAISVPRYLGKIRIFLEGRPLDFPIKQVSLAEGAIDVQTFSVGFGVDLYFPSGWYGGGIIGIDDTVVHETSWLLPEMYLGVNDNMNLDVRLEVHSVLLHEGGV